MAITRGKLLEDLRRQYGDSSQQSRDGVIAAHGGIENMAVALGIWRDRFGLIGSYDAEDVGIAFAVAVDLGYRMGQKSREVQS